MSGPSLPGLLRNGAPATADGGRLSLSRRSSPAIYAAVVLVATFTACLFSLRAYGIFACQASEYTADRYLGYCGSRHYGDYDHGAFWFGMEPRAVAAARAADVLFLGNSRSQFGFSSTRTAEWFAASGSRYYLLGFSHNANHRFAAPLLRRLQPRAKAYVINLDLFFEEAETPPARVVMRDSTAASRYSNKKGWQEVHKILCGHAASICGDGIAYFRSVPTGAWIVTGGHFKGAPVSYDYVADPGLVEKYTSRGREFLARLPVARECVLLTIVPTVNTPIGTATAAARGLGVDVIALTVEGLNTFDASHLDGPSAARWAGAFLDAAGPRLRRCIEQRPS